MSLHLHLDAVGGISGDMFMATMLALFPDADPVMRADLNDAGILQHVRLHLVSLRKNGMAAQHMQVETHSDAPPTRHWRDIRAFLHNSALDSAVKKRALDIFADLAEAEARCHDVPVDNVHFHEIADWDSLADIVAAASLIERSGVAGWSVGPLPMGQGFITTAHGKMPVPAPATTDLLRGFLTCQDQAVGERITPTGAAILKHLIPDPKSHQPNGSILRQGTGAGTKDFPNIPNILRGVVLVVDDPKNDSDQVVVLSFDIDDMTPEELTVALAHIDNHPGVLDVGHTLGYGKKGRLRFSVQVLAQPAAQDAVVDLCFAETSTIGLRLSLPTRQILRRRHSTVAGMRLKSVDRPGGETRKVESDDLAGTKTLKARREMAQRAQQ